MLTTSQSMLAANWSPFCSRVVDALLLISIWRWEPEVSQNRQTSTSNTARSRRVLTQGCCFAELIKSESRGQQQALE